MVVLSSPGLLRVRIGIPSRSAKLSDLPVPLAPLTAAARGLQSAPPPGAWFPLRTQPGTTPGPPTPRRPPDAPARAAARTGEPQYPGGTGGAPSPGGTARRPRGHAPFDGAA